MRVRLTHHCRKPGCVGNIGDLIEVSKSDADYLFDRGGAVRITETAATAPRVETAAKRTTPAKGREN